MYCTMYTLCNVLTVCNGLLVMSRVLFDSVFSRCGIQMVEGFYSMTICTVNNKEIWFLKSKIIF